ncbi:MAG: ABC transporter permease [Deltaproteobacteria bacterium]|jgi:putative ABC transport system permease protein|nr:ABC transporter permease [Deltaproteobacteria bacterium]
MTLYALSGALSLGLGYGLMVLGVYITFRILDFPDLTVDGSLPLGAAVSAVLITKGWDPFLSLLPAAGAGFLAGMVTGALSTKLRILNLLASIITMTALYSINIRIMGRPNISLISLPTVFSPLGRLDIPTIISSNIVFLSFILFAVALLSWLMRTEYGQALVATGDNPRMIKSLGVNTNFTIITGVGISNAMVAVSGALIAQNQGSADVSSGIGTIVAGLASIVVGETLFPSSRVGTAIIAVVLGSVVYRLVIALAMGLNLGGFSFTASDLQLITATLVVVALVLPMLRKKGAR